MRTFPSDCQVIRSHEMSRHIVSVFGKGWGCVASGATPAEADAQAMEWSWQNVRRLNPHGNLMAALARLDKACDELCSTLSTR